MKHLTSKLNKMIDYIDKNTSSYDNDFKIGFMLFIVVILMILKGDIFN